MHYVFSISLGSGLYRHISMTKKCTIDDVVYYGLKAFSYSKQPKSVYVQRRHEDACWRVGEKFDLIVNDSMFFHCRILRETEGDEEKVYVLKSVGTLLGKRFDPILLKPFGVQLQLEEIKATTEQYDLVKKYLNAYANLYSVISMKDGYMIFNKHNPGQLTAEQFKEMVKLASRDEEAHSMDRYPAVIDDYIIDHIDEDEYEEILNQQAGKPLYIPSKEKLLSFDEVDSPEGTIYEEHMLAFLKKELKIKDAEELLMELIGNIRMGDNMEEALATIEEWAGKFFNMQQMNRLLQVYNELHNHTRMPINRGHSPAELRKYMPQRGPAELSFGPGILQAIENGTMDGHELISGIEKIGLKVAAETKEKVGRNDTCPCGSGKKYKNCCGKVH